MDKKTYYVITVSCKEDSDLIISYALAVPNNQNLWCIIESINTITPIKTLNACDTKKQALEIVHAWNKTYADNGDLWLGASFSSRAIFR